MYAISTCDCNKKHTYGGSTWRYARRAGPLFSLNILRSILRALLFYFFILFLFFFFTNDRCISRTRDTKVAVTTPYVKKGLQDRASSKKDSVLWSIDREEFVERSFIYNEDMDACVFHSSAPFKDHKSHLRSVSFKT